MKFRHLNIYKTVCEEGNMTKAAGKLFMTQPSVSQAIRELEAHYEVRLFDRISRKLYLTSAGEELLKYANHMISLNDNLEDRMKNLSDLYALKLGATVTIGTYSMGKWVARFKSKFPNSEIKMQILNTKRIEESLLKSELDLALVEGEVDSEDLIVRPFMKDELVLVCASEDYERYKNIRCLKDLRDMNFLIREEGSGSRRMFVDKVYEQDVQINVVAEFSSNEAIKNGVISRLGIGVLSKSAISISDEVMILDIDDLEMIRDYSLVYHKDKYLNAGLEAFIEFITSYEN